MEIDGRCSVCGRAIHPGVFQVNFCRAFISLAFVEQYPGMTAWELSQKTGVAYADIMEGLNKARAYRWVRAESEEREQGGIRYRYFALEDRAILDAAKESHREGVLRMAGR